MCGHTSSQVTLLIHRNLWVSDSFILKILVKIEEGFSFGREGLCYERKVVTGGVMNWMTG